MDSANVMVEQVVNVVLMFHKLYLNPLSLS